MVPFLKASVHWERVAGQALERRIRHMGSSTLQPRTAEKVRGVSGNAAKEISGGASRVVARVEGGSGQK